MVNMPENDNPHLPQFLANSMKKKEEIESNPKLLMLIKEAIQEFSEERLQTYYQIVDGELGLKNRQYEADGMLEVCISADIFHPEFGTFPFVVLINTESKYSGLTYLIKDWGRDSQELPYGLDIKDYISSTDFEKIIKDPQARSNLKNCIRETGPFLTKDEEIYSSTIKNTHFVEALGYLGYDAPLLCKSIEKRGYPQIGQRGNIKKVCLCNPQKNLFTFDVEGHNLVSDNLLDDGVLNQGIEGRGQYRRLSAIWNTLNTSAYTLTLRKGA
ncbi:TPA: hypothetical protein HA361_00165 [Candidatus Woesearchaeota archaeon]|nr:hypothetical protein [Candidatus Woesearchaeota archaeon]HII69037.1 hypothetical protein [Candidatus Woesearchaeota archaeon]